MEYTIENARSALKQYFGYDGFRDKQEDVISSILNGGDLLALLATGAGKSICFQIPALLNDGTCLVISPFVALMKDQVDSLKAIGVAADLVNSAQDEEESIAVMERLAKGQCKFIYVAPERLQNKLFRSVLSRIKLSFVAVDECHCVSIMGHEFRPDYLKISTALTYLEKSQGNRLQRVALTATAKPEVRDDICHQLALESPTTIVSSFARDNIYLNVTPCAKEDIITDLAKAISAMGSASVIIYGSTRKQVEEVTKELNQKGIAADCYHGGMDRFKRTDIQERFISGEVTRIVATKAFGTGLDKSDVRAVFHVDMPDSIEDYFQEVGRAGRDGAKSQAVALFDMDGAKSRKQFLVQASYPPIQAIQQVMRHFQQSKKLVSGSPEWMANQFGGVVEAHMVDAIIRLLIGADFISFQRLAGGNRAVFELINANAPVNLKDVQVRRSIAIKNIEAIDRVFNLHGCRTAVILKYLGEQLDDGYACGHCDNCLAKGTEKDRARQMLVALHALHGSSQELSKSLLANILTGIRNESIVIRGLETSSGYGKLSFLTAKSTHRLIGELIDHKLVEEVDKHTHSLRLTRSGRNALRQGSAFFDANKQQNKAGGHLGELSTGASSKAREKLQALRNKLAIQYGVEPSVLYSDAVLSTLIKRHPKDLSQLRLVAGFNDKKVSHFGQEILECFKK